MSVRLRPAALFKWRLPAPLNYEVIFSGSPRPQTKLARLKIELILFYDAKESNWSGVGRTSGLPCWNERSGFKTEGFERIPQCEAT